MELMQSERDAATQMLEAARVLAKQNEIKRAVAFYKEACARLPNRADAHREMAVLLLRQALDAWLPWDKNRWAREAALAAGQAERLGDMDGDCLFIVAEVGGMLDMHTDAIPSMLQEAFARYQMQMDRGEAVSAFYLATALRMAQINEARGQEKAAISYYGILSGAAELERTGRVRAGSSTPEQTQRAWASIARLQGLAG